MSTLLLKTNGLFARAADGRLLFFATPVAGSAYIVPDAEREDALRTLSKYWGLCEILSVAMIAPVALHFGPLALLAVFALFALGSGIAYQFALRGLVAGLESIPHPPLTGARHTVSLASLLRTVAEETHPSLLWLCEAASVLPLAGAAITLFNGQRLHHFAGSFLALVFFGTASAAGAWMISIKNRGAALDPTPSLVERNVASGG